MPAETSYETIDQVVDWIRHRCFGKYRGTVVDNNDPTNRGRLKVNVPAALGDVEVWALPCVPYTGNGVGVCMMPVAGAGVWVEFEGGDPSFPIWTGGFWADDELPMDEQGRMNIPTSRVIRTESGLMLTFDDNGKKITLTDEDGSNIITIDVQPGTIKVKATTKVIVEAPQIELVENATHPIVFGDELMSYLNQMVMLFNAHTHPGELAMGVIPITPAPPTPSFQAPTNSLISTKVKAG